MTNGPKTCEECGKILKNAQGYNGHMRSHSKAIDPNIGINAGLTTLTAKLIGVMTALDLVILRLDKLENPTFKAPEAPKEEQIARNLQATVEINREIKHEDMLENPKCAYGIHYPSDFGQNAFFDNQGKPIPGKFTPAKRKCMPATSELRKIIDEILTFEFEVDILPDPMSATFMLNIIIPQKYCIRDEYRFGTLKDIRAKVINNFTASAEVRDYALKVKKKIFEDHQSVQMASPFTVASMKEYGAPVGGGNVGYTQKQVLV